MKLITIILIIFIFIQPVYAKIIDQDDGGEWRINTFENEDERMAYVLVQKVWDKDEKKIVLHEVIGYIDSRECGVDFQEKKVPFAESKVDAIIKTINELFKGKYSISVSVSVCHPKWFVVYLWDGETWGTKEVFEQVFEKLKQRRLL